MTNWKRFFFIITMTAVLASAQAKRPLCPNIAGKTVSVSGTITGTGVEDGTARYDLDSKDSPCMSLYFAVVDPKGRLLCKEGQEITASGVVKVTTLGADLITTDYSCK